MYKFLNVKRHHKITFLHNFHNCHQSSMIVVCPREARFLSSCGLLCMYYPQTRIWFLLITATSFALNCSLWREQILLHHTLLRFTKFPIFQPSLFSITCKKKNQTRFTPLAVTAHTEASSPLIRAAVHLLTCMPSSEKICLTFRTTFIRKKICRWKYM